MLEGDSVVATYNAHVEAEDAVKVLRLSGYDITKLSIIDDGCRIEERIVGFYSEEQRVRYWSKWGALCGSVVGLASGVALFSAPSVTAGLVIKLVAVATGASLLIGGLCAAGAVLYGKVLTKDSSLKYELAGEGAQRFTLVARDEALAAQARETILNSDSLTIRLQQRETTELTDISSVPLGAARLAFERRRARLRRRSRSKGTKVWTCPNESSQN